VKIQGEDGRICEKRVTKRGAAYTRSSLGHRSKIKEESLLESPSRKKWVKDAVRWWTEELRKREKGRKEKTVRKM